MKVLVFAKDENMQFIDSDAHAQKSISYIYETRIEKMAICILLTHSFIIIF